MKTILIADDDCLVRQVAACMLKARGFNVLQAGSGEEAMAVWERQAAMIDLLFTDLQMPGMNGGELAELLEAHQPGLKVLFTSGSGECVVEENLLRWPERNFLPKPYGFRELIEAVASAIEPGLAVNDDCLEISQ
jgi:two-component system cell cycle sensor histidine kinase/response regulator CckA